MLPDEGGTRTASQSNSAAASNDGEHETAPQEHVKVTAEETKEEREQKVKEARKGSDAKEHRERDRRVLEKVQRERDRMERAHRERDRREEKRRERSKMDRKSTDAARSSHRAQKTWRDEKQDTDARRVRRDPTLCVCLHFCKME